MNENSRRSPIARRAAILIAGAALAASIACSSSSDDAPPPDISGSCSAVASACHPYDKISAIGHECHELGHGGNDSACAPRKAECIAACPPREAGTSTIQDSGSTGDATTDGPAADAQEDAGDICTPYCECLTATCASQTGYPFDSAEDCKTHCGQLSAEEKVCLPKWCEKAKTLGDKMHVCEHAWGKLGLDECETL